MWGKFYTGGWGKNRYSKENSANTNAIVHRIDHLGFLCCGVWILAGSNKSKRRQHKLIRKWTSQLSVFSQLVTSLAFIEKLPCGVGGEQELHWWLILFLTHWLQSPVDRCTKPPVWNTENETEHVHMDVCAHLHMQHIDTGQPWKTIWPFRFNLCHLQQTQQPLDVQLLPSSFLWYWNGLGQLFLFWCLKNDSDNSES